MTPAAPGGPGQIPYDPSFDLAEAIAILERTPRVLRELLGGAATGPLPERWLRADEGPDTWSPFDVVGHLIDGEETDWIGRAKTILEHGPSRPFDPFDRFRHLAANRGRSIEELLEKFAQLRARNIETLRGFHLTPEKLNLHGTHPALGDVTMAQLLATWVVHDLGHIAQIARAMAGRYRPDVGPWQAYLPVLDPRGRK